MKYSFAFILVLLSGMIVARNSQIGSQFFSSTSDSLFTPVNFKVDSLTALATWDNPSIVILDENFESPDFLPAGWQSISVGASDWVVTDDATSINMLINEHSRYIASSDFNAGQFNNGCCDRLITPFLDLSQTDSATLIFNSFFSGAFNEKASVEISLDAGVTWQVLSNLEPDQSYLNDWKRIKIDLSEFAGEVGNDSVLICFHADDSGQQASGWALDDIKVEAFVKTIVNYSVWLNDTYAGYTTHPYWQFDRDTLQFGQLYKAEVAANYLFGQSQHDSINFWNKYLPFPYGLQASVNMSGVIITWHPPVFGNTGLESHLLNYKLYANDSLIAVLPVTENSYWFFTSDQREYCFMLTAVYDLSSLGYPNQIGESSPAGPACVQVYYCCILPFFEDWASATFTLNNWQAGPNWVISPTEGIPLPCARFNRNPALVNYSSPLEMFPVTAPSGTATPHDVFLEFDMALEDSLANGTESLSFQYKETGGEWITIASFTNQGNMAWTHFEYPLNYPHHTSTIHFKIVASGVNSLNIDHWLVDNIVLQIKYSLNPPLNLTATEGPSFPNELFIEWNTPLDTLVYKSTSGVTDLMQYDLYRRCRFPQPGNWALIASTTTNWYDDMNLPSNCYDYYVVAVYKEGGESSNVDSLNCIAVGQAEVAKTGIRLYPNPTHDLLKIELEEYVVDATIINSYGEIIRTPAIKPSSKLTFNVADLPPGIYALKFLLANGNFLTRTFIKS
jgi:hypothetical protein